MGSNVFVTRAYSGTYTALFCKLGYVGLDWFNRDPIKEGWDLTDKIYLKKQYREHDSRISERSLSIKIGQLLKFINDIKINDIVICPYSDGSLLIGKIKSDLYFSNDKTSPFCWRRKVNWIKPKINRSNFSKELQFALRSSLIIYKIKQSEEIINSIK